MENRKKRLKISKAERKERTTQNITCSKNSLLGIKINYDSVMPEKKINNKDFYKHRRNKRSLRFLNKFL